MNVDELTVDCTENRMSSVLKPRNRLMLAVLAEALSTFERGLGSTRAERRHQFHEVDRWIASHDTDWPFSFENICSCLDIDPDYIRAGLERMKRDAFASARQDKRDRRRARIYDRHDDRTSFG